MTVRDLGGVCRATIVAAHPDDETLGAAGLAQRLYAEGVELSLVIATDGEAAFPRSGEHERRRLAALRRREVTESLAALGLGELRPVWLGLPDSGLHQCRERLVDELSGLLADSDLCLAPWPGDPHPDHREAGLAALRAAPENAQCWSYPIWMWHRLDPGDPAIPWHRGHTHRLTGTHRLAKAAAIEAFSSQTGPGPAGEDPILPPEVLAHFDRPDEVFFHEPREQTTSPQRFITLYESGPDPWRTETRWYERRKRATVLAALPRERYGTIVEPACGNGNLSRELAARCDRLRAFDPVSTAVEAAREATSGLPHVEIGSGALPHDLTHRNVDLLVYSEILYYLGDDDLGETIERSARALRPGGDLLAVHWKPWAPDAPRDGGDAHARLLAHPGLEALVAHEDVEFTLHVLRRR